MAPAVAAAKAGLVPEDERTPEPATGRSCSEVKMELDVNDLVGGVSGGSVPTQVVTLGGGCFWCTEAVFLDVRGVLAVEPGYAGGHVKNPTYEAVCAGDTGHAEVVQLRFDPAVISLSDILAIFFTIHDPTTLNRQGHDVGTQYRSVIFYHDEAQGAAARQFIRQLEDEKVFRDPIVTEVAPLTEYSTAEAYHHRYFEQHPSQGYCTMVVAPKLAKFRKVHSALRRR